MSAVPNTPLVSVIMPMHNSAATLQRAVESVRAQSIGSWELIAVDDASSDTTPQLARELARQDERVRLLVLDRNLGAAGARNAGIDAASGTYLHFLDSDDALEPRAFELLIDAERVAGTGAAAGEYTINNGERTLWRHRRLREQLGARELVSDADLVTHSHLVRADRFGRLRFRTDLSGFEDSDLWLRLAESGVRWTCVPSSVARYHIRPGSLTKNAARMLEDGLRVLDDLAARSAGSSQRVSAFGVERARRRKVVTWSTRWAVIGGAAEARGAAETVIARGAWRVPAHWAGEVAVYQTAQGLGIWPTSDNAELWAPALLAFWNALFSAGRLRDIQGAVRAFARAAVRPRDVALSILVQTGRSPVNILGYGRNGRELVEAARAQGIEVFVRDHRRLEGLDVPVEPIGAPHPPERAVVVSPDADAGLVPLAGPKYIRWAGVRERLARDLLHQFERPEFVRSAA